MSADLSSLSARRHDHLQITVRAAAEISGATYRQLDYWCREGIIKPSIHGSSGSGSGPNCERLYSFQDVVAIRLVYLMLCAGFKMESVRQRIKNIREDLSGLGEVHELTINLDDPSTISIVIRLAEIEKEVAMACDIAIWERRHSQWA